MADDAPLYAAEPWDWKFKRLFDAAGNPIASFPGEHGADNAERAIRCVRACEGVSTANLHPGDMHDLVMELDDVKQQRDALLTACKGLLALPAAPIQFVGQTAVRDKAVAAIAKAEAGY